MEYKDVLRDLQSRSKLTDNCIKELVKEVKNTGVRKQVSDGALRVTINKNGSVRVAFARGKDAAIGELHNDFNTYAQALELAAERRVEQSRTPTNITVHAVVDEYLKNGQERVDAGRIKASSLRTETLRCRLVINAFDDKERFAEVGHSRIVEACESIQKMERDGGGLYSDGYVRQVFEAIGRVWKFGSSRYLDGVNRAANLHVENVYRDTDSDERCEVHTTNKGIAKVWLGVKTALPVQKNAVHFMALTGVRPMNISNLLWSYVKHDRIEFPQTSMKASRSKILKSKAPYIIPISPAIQKILDEQRGFHDTHVFYGVKDRTKKIGRSSLNVVFKNNFDNSELIGLAENVEDVKHKGSAGAFLTLCRKLVYTNIVEALSSTRSDAEVIASVCCNHSVRSGMAVHYLHKDYFAAAVEGFRAHERLLFTAIEELKREGYVPVYNSYLSKERIEERKKIWNARLSK